MSGEQDQLKGEELDRNVVGHVEDKDVGHIGERDEGAEGDGAGKEQKRPPRISIQPAAIS